MPTEMTTNAGAFNPDEYSPTDFNDIAVTTTMTPHKATNISMTATDNHANTAALPTMITTTTTNNIPLINTAMINITNMSTTMPANAHTTLPTNPAALFHTVFHSNPTFAASFMALIQQYQQTNPNHIILSIPQAPVTPRMAPPNTPTTTTPAPFTTPPHHNTNHTNHSPTFPSPKQWFLVGHNSTTTTINHQSTANNTHPTSNLTPTPTDTNNEDPNDDNKEIAYTQSDYAPPHKPSQLPKYPPTTSPHTPSSKPTTLLTKKSATNARKRTCMVLH
jgi:hypothetical protein